MGDRGIPRRCRHMNGYGSHTYLWVNAAGEKHWVKYHFHSDQGVEGLTGTEADARSPARTPTSTAATSTTRSTRGDFPRWTLSVQVMPYEDAKTYRFNPFDLTKVWPHSDYPLIKVGTMTLEPQPRQLLRPDRAGGLRAARARAGHRVLARQDAARPGVRLRRHAPLPDRPELPAAAGQPARASRRQHLHVRTARWPTSTAATQPVYAPNSYGRGYADVTGEVEDGWEADGEMVRAGLHAARGRRRLRPGRHAGPRGVGRRAARGASSRPSPATCSAASKGDVLERAFEYWKNVDADTGKQIEELVRGRRR